MCSTELDVVALQRGVHVAHPYRRASTTSDFTIRASTILQVQQMCLWTVVGRKMTVVRDQLFSQKPPGSSL